MDFEQALRAELITLTNLSGKLYPLFAPEGTIPPFVVYQKIRTDYVKTLDGTQTYRDGWYEFDLLATTYADLQLKYVALIDKLKTFVGRNIGTGGPFIQNVTVENVVELYENQVDWHRMNIEVKFYF